MNQEDPNIAGNFYNKYETANPIAAYLTKQFKSNLLDLVSLTNAQDIHEIGCGEGYLANHIYNHCQPSRFRASDYSADVIQLAQESNQALPIEFSAKSIYDLNPEDSAELIICCEVMEHLEHPEQALKKLQELAPKQLILSVPREPLWRILNMARFKYWSDLGNTPGHLQNWSQRQFLKLVSQYFQVDHIRSPYPWTMCLCRPFS